jgi:hypothetical protein
LANADAVMSIDVRASGTVEKKCLVDGCRVMRMDNRRSN